MNVSFTNHTKCKLLILTDNSGDRVLLLFSDEHDEEELSDAGYMEMSSGQLDTYGFNSLNAWDHHNFSHLQENGVNNLSIEHVSR